MKPTSIAFISGLYKQVCGRVWHTNPKISHRWFTVSTSETGGWGHHYTVAYPTYNSIQTELAEVIWYNTEY